jgi:hypothetical protein
MLLVIHLHSSWIKYLITEEKHKLWSSSLHYFYPLFFLEQHFFFYSLKHLQHIQVQLTSWASIQAHHVIQQTGSRYDHSLSYILGREFAKGGLPTAPVCPEGMHHIPWRMVAQGLQQPLCDPACLKCQSSLTGEHAVQSLDDNEESLYPEQLRVQHCCDMLGTSVKPSSVQLTAHNF